MKLTKIMYMLLFLLFASISQASMTTVSKIFNEKTPSEHLFQTVSDSESTSDEDEEKPKP